MATILNIAEEWNQMNLDGKWPNHPLKGLQRNWSRAHRSGKVGILQAHLKLHPTFSSKGEALETNQSISIISRCCISWYIKLITPRVGWFSSKTCRFLLHFGRTHPKRCKAPPLSEPSAVLAPWAEGFRGGACEAKAAGSAAAGWHRTSA